jgi:hypothetical protein
MSRGRPLTRRRHSHRWNYRIVSSKYKITNKKRSRGVTDEYYGSPLRDGLVASCFIWSMVNCFPKPQRVPPRVQKRDSLTPRVLYSMCFDGRWTNDKWVWITGGIILAGENKGTGKKTRHSATLSSTISTRTGLRTNPCLRAQNSGINPWRKARLNVEYWLIIAYSCR